MGNPKHVLTAAVGIVLPLLGGCGGRASTTTPSPLPPVAAPAPAPSPEAVSVATLAIASFEVTSEDPAGGVFWYFPTMVLTETSGKSAAYLQSIRFKMPNGDDFLFNNDAPPGTGCFLSAQSKAVPAGGSWDLNTVYRYCLDLDSRSDISGREIGVTVTFTDEDGRPGMVKGVAAVR